MDRSVERVTASGDVAQDVRSLVAQMGGIDRFVSRNERVLVKPSCNSPYPFPATTDLQVIHTIIELVRTMTGDVVVGESSGFMHKPTAVAFQGTGLARLAAEMEVPLVDFDEHEWTTLHDARATHLTEVRVTSLLQQFDRIIVLPTMRTHAWARITMALKIGMGLIPVSDRKRMHRTALEPMLGELNLFYQPDLVILDGRRCFINGGPDSGEEREPGLLLGGTGRVAIDTEAVGILQQYGAAQLDMPAREVPMIRTARELGLP